MVSPGKKVVCGGTSANIVARVLHRKIETTLNYADPTLPPTGKIQGIDLVTEGVLTLSRTWRSCAATPNIKRMRSISTASTRTMARQRLPS